MPLNMSLSLQIALSNSNGTSYPFFMANLTFHMLLFSYVYYIMLNMRISLYMSLNLDYSLRNCLRFSIYEES